MLQILQTYHACMHHAYDLTSKRCYACLSLQIFISAQHHCSIKARLTFSTGRRSAGESGGESTADAATSHHPPRSVSTPHQLQLVYSSSFYPFLHHHQCKYLSLQIEKKTFHKKRKDAVNKALHICTTSQIYCISNSTIQNIM